jgi:hypothetical protein
MRACYQSAFYNPKTNDLNAGFSTIKGSGPGAARTFRRAAYARGVPPAGAQSQRKFAV